MPINSVADRETSAAGLLWMEPTFLIQAFNKVFEDKERKIFFKSGVGADQRRQVSATWIKKYCTCFVSLLH